MLKSLLMLAIFTVFTVFAWISLTIYHNLTTSTIAPEIQTKITPIFPSFDLDTVAAVQERLIVEVNLSEQYLLGTTTPPTTTPTPNATTSATPTRIPTPTRTPTPTP